MKNLISSVIKGTEIIDKFTESSQERQKTLSDRHSADMGSDNWLSKSIRPLVLLTLLFLQVLIVVLSAFGKHVDIAIVSQHGVLLTGAFSFYFSSRKAEKVAAQNAKANIELEKIKTKHDNKIELKKIKQSKRNKRREERSQEK